MTRTSLTASAMAVLAATALVFAATASAGLPKPKQALVVPFQSIGVVKFGTRKSTAVDKWGQPRCAIGTGGRDTCSWSASTSTNFPEEAATLELSGGKVCGMGIRAGTNSATDSLSITKLKKWKTKEGVGLGSKLKAAKQLLGGKLVVTRHHVTTAISGGFTDSTKNKVEEIRIFKENCPIT
jgi:hypothetical protein